MDKITLTLTVAELQTIHEAMAELNDKARHGELYHYDASDHAALNSAGDKVYKAARLAGIVY